MGYAVSVRLNLLGSPRLEVPDGPGAGESLGAKPLALLAFLAMEPGPHEREELATLLWSDSTDHAARTSLRQALSKLKKALGALLVVEHRWVELDPAVSCDARDFEVAVHTAPEQAIEFPADRFLAGFPVKHASVFEEWREARIQTLRRGLREAFRTLTRRALERSHWREAADLAERWIACDQLSDQAVRACAEAYHMAGDRGAAVACYEEYRTRLGAQTGTEPPPALTDFISRICSARAVEVLTPPPAETKFPEHGFAASLIGREAEWSSLMDVWQRVTAGRSWTVLINGEPGIGKTRIAEDLAQWTMAGGATTLKGRGYDTDLEIPYLPVVEALRGAVDAPGIAATAPEWLAELSRVLPEVKERFAHLPESSIPGDTDRRWRLFESVAQVLLALASERPTVLFIDDVQRCDADTCSLLHFLTTRFEDAPILFVMTMTLGAAERRSPAVRLCEMMRSAGDWCTVMKLSPLSEGDVRSLIQELGGIRDPDGARRFAAQVHALSDGNPFYVLELLKALFAQGTLSADPETGEWVVVEADERGSYEYVMPLSVHDALAERWERLPYELRDVLVTVAVAGRPVTADVLSYVHGLSRLRAAALADALVERLLLAVEGGAYRCAHPIMRDLVRHDLTPARYAEVHRAIALALDSLARSGRPGAAAGEIARHAVRGNEPALAYERGMEAAGEAHGGGRYEEALSWLDLAGRVAASRREMGAVEELTSRVLASAGWSEVPRQLKQVGTPARGFARKDLDLKKV